MPLSRRHRGSTINIWPGFVDALAQLLMVIIFVLLVFTVGQFYLSGAVSDRDTEIRTLTRQLNNLSDMLSLDKRESDELHQNIATLQLNLQEAAANQDKLTGQIAAADAKAQSQAQALATAQGQADDAQKKLAAAEGDVGARDATIATLNQNVEALRQQLADIAKALDLSQTENKTQQGQIADLGQKLNLALAAKVEDLAQFRSEFFGRLRQILGERPDIRIVGDRFVFQSEVLFDPGSADLGAGARQQLAPVVSALKEIAGKIPKNLHWILEVDGHTDRRPINTPQFKSNWELSSARAVTVVNYLISQGIPADHLAAAGFAEWQPLDTSDTAEALRHNRRIELKLTQR